METRKINIRLAFKWYDKKKSGFIGWLISVFTNSIYYHVEIIIDKIWISSNPDSGGITIGELKTLNSNWDYCHVGVVEITEKQYLNLMHFISEQKGTKYDWMGIILSQFLPFKFHSKKKWFCSEIVTKLLQLVIVPTVNNVEPVEMSPKDLAVLFNFNKKYFN